ncbi:RluA family pseudouridine synthase [Patescibacteria group bacterium]|nr:RluA family pseudouridine synthase [Patescibacteria group bacterium]
MNELKVLYEDSHFLAIDKPTGILVYQPAGAKESITLLDLVRGKLSFDIPSERDGIVHRLDKETSGVILIAKDKEAEFNLKKLFKDRKVEKYYQALVWGNVNPNEGRIEIPLGRSSKERLRVVPRSSGKPAVTNYKKIKYYPKSDMSLLDIKIETGRMHQIRVHLSAIGYPVVGDKKYSNKKTELARQFLHAKKIVIINPYNKKRLVLNSGLADDLSAFLNRLS